ncbi:MAG: carboxypeptidase-like regulatory domain-containing protein [Planctomycetota bacterium]
MLPPVVAAAEQRLRCLDEGGQPVADAEVRLVRVPPGSAVTDLRASSDHDGQVVFPAVPPAQYEIRAHAGFRHHQPDRRDRYRTLPATPFDCELRELWLGGLEMPGTEVVKWGGRTPGFEGSTDGKAEKDLIATWRTRHPEAVFYAMFRNPRRPATDTIQARVTWFGHAQHERTLRLWPASTFPGPETIDPASVPQRDWARLRVVLTDATGQALPEVLQATLRDRAQLTPDVPQPGMGDFFTFPRGTAALPAGAYALRLFDARNSHMVPVATGTVARDTTELRLRVAAVDRVVRLHLRGVTGAGYGLSVAHESGRTANELGRADGEHTLLLPPGPCVTTVRRRLPDGREETLEHAFTVGDAVEQDVTWDLLAPR